MLCYLLTYLRQRKDHNNLYMRSTVFDPSIRGVVADYLALLTYSRQDHNNLYTSSTVFEPVLVVRVSRWEIYTEAIYYCEFNFREINSGKINFCSNGFNHKRTKIIFCMMTIGCVETGSRLIGVQPGDVHEKTIVLALLSFALLLPCAIVLCDFVQRAFDTARFCLRGFVGTNLSCVLLSGHRKNYCCSYSLRSFRSILLC